MKQLLTDIQNRLKTVTALKYIDEDWGQLDYFNVAQPVKYPCALINIASVQYSNMAKKVQQGLGTVVITIADLKLANSSANAPQLQKQAAWKVFDIIADVYKALHGWNGASHYGPLTRVSLTRKKNDEGLNLFDVAFSFTIKDVDAMPAQNRHSPVTIEVQGPFLEIPTP